MNTKIVITGLVTALLVSMVGNLYLNDRVDQLEYQVNSCEYEKPGLLDIEEKLTTVKAQVDNIEVSPECPECPEPRCPKPSCPECDKGLFKRMLEAQAENHEYKSKYNCDEFADELVRRLSDKGFDAEGKTIQVNCNLWGNKESCQEYDGMHRIVEVDNLYIEAVTGDVINPQEYEKYDLG